MTYRFTSKEDLGFYRPAPDGETDTRASLDTTNAEVRAYQGHSFTPLTVAAQAAPGQPIPEDKEPEEPTP